MSALTVPKAPVQPLAVVAGVGLIVAIDALVIIVAHLVDPGAPVLYLSNLVALFIGAIQLLFGVPLILLLRRRRPSLAMGVGLGMVLVLVANGYAFFH
jgi:hypothetical protein